MEKHTNKNTMEKVSSMLLSGFVPEVPSSTCRCQHISIHWDKSLVLSNGPDKKERTKTQ